MDCVALLPLQMSINPLKVPVIILVSAVPIQRTAEKGHVF
jgi:hypothetical protein